MTNPNRLTDERLAWLAAREHCDRQASAHSGGFWLATLLTGRGRRLSASSASTKSGGAAARREQRANKMAAYAFIVDDLARQLSPEERARLRASNTLPDWFLPRADEEFSKQWKADA